MTNKPARHLRGLLAGLLATSCEGSPTGSESGIESWTRMSPGDRTQTENELPQPQLPVVLGLPNLKPAPWSPST